MHCTSKTLFRLVTLILLVLVVSQMRSIVWGKDIYAVYPMKNYRYSTVISNLYGAERIAINSNTNGLFLIQSYTYLYWSPKSDSLAKQESLWREYGSSEAVFEIRGGRAIYMFDGAQDPWGNIQETDVTFDSKGHIAIRCKTYVDEYTHFYNLKTKREISASAAKHLNFHEENEDTAGNIWWVNAYGEYGSYVNIQRKDGKEIVEKLPDLSKVTGKDTRIREWERFEKMHKYKADTNTVIIVAQVCEQLSEYGGFDKYHYAIFEVGVQNGTVKHIASIYGWEVDSMVLDKYGNIYVLLDGDKVIEIKPIKH